MPSITSIILEDPARAGQVRACLLELGLIGGFRGDAFAGLMAQCASLDELAAQPWRRLASACPPALAERLRKGVSAEVLAAAAAWEAVPGRWRLTPVDADYPASLLQLPEPPPVLWGIGNPHLLAHPALAVVGSRRATPQGLSDARAFSRHLGEAGLTIVSGLAEGIDGAAHQGALDTLGSTVAVLAHGLDRIYPPAHRDLAHRIAAQGALVSEYPLGTPALRHHFPERNRLISGLALGVLVVEATVASGSLVTARLAMEQGREVMALPASIHAALGKGCNQLIRDGATLVESADHVWTQLAAGLQAFQLAAPAPATLAPPSDPYDPVLSMLQSAPANPDQIATAIGLTPAQVSSILGREELEQRVVRLPDGRYQRVASTPEIAVRSGEDS